MRPSEKEPVRAPLCPQPPCLHPAIDSQLLTGAKEKPKASWELQVHLWHSGKDNKSAVKNIFEKLIG